VTLAPWIAGHNSKLPDTSATLINIQLSTMNFNLFPFLSTQAAWLCTAF
jgi:hypothetical protein